MVQDDPESTNLMLPASDNLLPHTELNVAGKTTVVFIHGAFSSRRDWKLVTPYLSEHYHLLVPDLPGHGQLEGVTPFSVKTSSDLLAKLIREKAHNGIACVIGLSLGARIGIDLASRYPERIDRVFVSGYGLFASSSLSRYVPYVLWTMQRVENLMPRAMVRWLMDGADIQVHGGGPSLALCRQVAGPLTEGSQWPESWPAATLIVVAGKSGILPTSDNPDVARKLAQIGIQVNPDTVAVTHAAMRHPWCLQAPLLFAETARSWFEGAGLLSGFERL